MSDTIEKFKKMSKAVGVGMYEEISEKHKAILAFGMTDVSIIEAFQNQIIPTMQEYNVPASELGKLETQFVLGLMEAATQEGKMIA